MCIIFQLHIHATAGFMGNLHLKRFKAGANFVHGDLYSAGVEFKLIPYNSSEIPAGIFNYDDVVSGTVDNAHRYYVQWSGGFERERLSTAKNLAATFKEMINASRVNQNEHVLFIIRGHSHGGTIGLLFIELMKDIDNVYFIVDTTATPLDADLIKKNYPIYQKKILVWQHHYNPKDWTYRIGSLLLWQFSQIFYRIEDILPAIPLGWKSHSITSFWDMFREVHNNFMRGGKAKQICKIMRPRIETIVEVIKEVEFKNLSTDEFYSQIENKMFENQFPDDPPEPEINDDSQFGIFRHF